MSLVDQIKKDEEELARLQALEDEEHNAPSQDSVDQEEEEPTQNEEEQVGDNDNEEEVEEGENDTSEEEESKNPNDIAAKLRIERRERLKLQEELAELRRQRETLLRRQRETFPDEEELSEAEQQKINEQDSLEIKVARIEAERYNAKLHQQAQEELSAIENEYMKTTPDYADAASHMIKAMHQGAKAAFPNLGDREAVNFVQGKVMEIASRAAQNGMNPAEVFYQMAYDQYGYSPDAQKSKSKQGGVDKVNNLKTVAKNKKRSASPLSGGGQIASSNVSIEEALNMDVADFGKLSESQINEILEQAG